MATLFWPMFFIGRWSESSSTLLTYLIQFPCCRTVVLLTQLLPTACFIVLVKDERAKLKCELSYEKSHERSIAFFDKKDVDRNWVRRIYLLVYQFWNNIKVASFFCWNWRITFPSPFESVKFFRKHIWRFEIVNAGSRSSSVWKARGETNKKKDTVSNEDVIHLPNNL